MTRKRSVLGGMALLALMALITVGAISASAGTSHAKPSASKQLVGSWMVTVNRGPTLPPLKSLQSFTKGHAVIEISNSGATVRSPAHGAWKRIGGRKYASTIVFFRYDPQNNGAYVGTLKLRRELELALDGQSFTGGSVAELRDANGNLLPGSNTRRDAETAERINVEPVPDLP